jgi:hypothetical protein
MITDTHVLNLVSIVFQGCCMTCRVEYLRNEEAVQVIYVQASKFSTIPVTIVAVER